MTSLIPYVSVLGMKKENYSLHLYCDKKKYIKKKKTPSLLGIYCDKIELNLDF